MIAYPDTSFLCAIYRRHDNSPQAAAYFQKMPEPLHVTSLLLYEFRQSVRFQASLFGKDRHKGFSKDAGVQMLADLQSDIADGAVAVVPADWPDVHQIAERLSGQHPPAGNHRAFDILHVATALHLGARQFLTFDAKQQSLARAEGLKVKP